MPRSLARLAAPALLAALLPYSAASPPPAAGYSEAEALQFVYLAGAAYCSAGLEDWSCDKCGHGRALDHVTVFHDQHTDIRGYVGRDADRGEAVVAFRGTMPSSMENWVENLDATSEEVEAGDERDGRVHKGFNEAWESVRPAVERALARAELRGLPVSVTGHSLGGALATLAARHVAAALGREVAHVYSFGSPRVGNAKFAERYNALLAGVTWRVTHWRDVVPGLPPAELWYRHVSREVFYNDDASEYTVCSIGVEEDPACQDQLWVKDSVDDHLHYLGRYISGCE